MSRSPHFTPRFLSLEDRVVPVVTVREAAGLTAASIVAARDAFRADLGGGVIPGADGGFGGARREVNWDGVPDVNADPALLPADFFQTQSPRGLILTVPGATPGVGVAVSQDGNTPPDADPDALAFRSLFPANTTAPFAAFSADRILGVFGRTTLELDFRVPGTNTVAGVRGFGVVFVDVDQAGSAKLEFLDAGGKSVFARDAVPAPGDGGFSFLGASFAPGDAERIARVRITAGQAHLGSDALDVSQGGPADLVAMDDFFYSEPTPLPRPFAVGGGSGGRVQLLDASGGVRSELQPFGADFTAGVRVATGDFDRDGVADVVAGTGPSVATRVRVLSGADGGELFAVTPFEETFKGGVFVAAGDLTGDGIPDLVVSPDEGGGPRVRVFSGAGFGQVADFFGIDDANFRGGARPAVGDVTGDGTGDLIVAAGFGGGPRVTAFDGHAVTAGNAGAGQLFNLFVFEPTLRNGAYIAAGDFDGDGAADLVAGGGPGGGPRVRILDGRDLAESGGSTETTLGNFFVGDVAARGGVRVAVANLDHDARADLVTGSGLDARVTGFSGLTITPADTPPELFAIEAASLPVNGVFVG
jgi:hypothetical protein